MMIDKENREMKKVSIITVCYNSERTIRKTIESVLCQSYSNIEYIVIDGKSSDKTIHIIGEYMSRFAGRLRLISEPDNGIYDAMNKGISIATGELIGILNSDDYYEPEAVANMISAMKEDRYQILYGFMRSWKDGKEYMISRQSHCFLREGMICHPACFVTKTVYDNFGTFDLQYVSVADYDFMLRMSEISEIKFYPVNFLIANFELGGMSASETAWIELVKLKKNYGIISDKEYKKEMVKSRIYRIYKTIFKSKSYIGDKRGNKT